MMFQAPVPDEPDSHWTDCVVPSRSGGWFSRTDFDLIPPPPPTPPPPMDGGGRGGSPYTPRLLVVDDDEWIRDVLERLLIRSDYRVRTADSAEAAMDLLQTEAFDMVLTDILMSGKSGLDLTRHVVQTYSSLPVILITGCAEMGLMSQGMRLGASDYISKPFDFNAVPKIIECNLERARIAQEIELERTRIAQEIEKERIRRQITALVKAVETKEPHTAKHSRRVAHTSLCIAKEMELSEDECSHLEFAALVHDIGKIGTPDNILGKPDKLTEEEWAKMKNHPCEGAEIVIGLSEYVADIVRHHHERWDGTGYPHELREEDIPLLSRIIAVADAYDVMTSDRIYRGALPRDVAVARLREGAGQQFDSEIVEVFLRLDPASLLLLS